MYLLELTVLTNETYYIIFPIVTYLYKLECLKIYILTCSVLCSIKHQQLIQLPSTIRPMTSKYVQCFQLCMYSVPNEYGPYNTMQPSFLLIYFYLLKKKQAYTCKCPLRCMACQRLLWNLSQPAMECQACGAVIHKQCYSSAMKGKCLPSKKMIRMGWLTTQIRKRNDVVII